MIGGILDSILGEGNSLIGSGMSGVGSFVSGWGAMDATKDYNAQMRKLDTLARDWNYQRFLESRGQGGNALLPLYFQQGTETGLANDALSAYNAMRAASGTPSEEIARYTAATQAMEPAMAEGDSLINRLFNGQLTEEEIRNIQPVLAARGAVATSQKTGILEGLTQRLNALSADRAKAGYTGGGSAFQKNLLTNATIPALQAASTVGAQADLANATDVSNIKNAGLTRKLNSLALPLNQVENRIRMATAPQAGAGASQAGRMNLFNWFKMQPQAYNWNNIPAQNLTPNLMMAGGSALSAGGQVLAGSGSGGMGGMGGVGGGGAPQVYNSYQIPYTPPNQGYDYNTPMPGGDLYG